MKLSFGAICLLCISLLTSCNKSSPDNTPDPPPPVTVTITGVSPKTVTEGDTLTITGTSFGTDPAKVKVFFDYAGFSTSYTPIKVSPTQLTIVVPKSNSTALVPNPATCHPGIEVNGGDQIFSEVTFTYLYPAVYYTFSGVSARLGEFISLNGPFYKNQVADSIRVRFSGSNQWIRPIAGSDITYIDVREGYFYYKNVLIRVPADAHTGPIEVASDLLAPGKTDSSLTVLPLLPDPTPGVWTTRGDLVFVGHTSLSGKTEAAAFTINNRAYIATGNTGAPLDGYGTTDVWEFDPQYYSWRPMANFPMGHRTGSSVFSIGNKGYLCGGFDKNRVPTRDFWEFDPATNTWTKKADFPGKARARAVGFSIGNLGYIGSGQDTSGLALSDFFQYDPASDSWTALPAMPIERSSAFAFVVNNKAYIDGGWKGQIAPHPQSALTDMYMFDPAAKTWTVKAPMTGNVRTSMNASFVLNGKGYVGLGNTVSGWQGSKVVVAYDPPSDTWAPVPSFRGLERTGAVGFAIGNTGYFSHGFAIGGALTFKDTWAYIPN